MSIVTLFLPQAIRLLNLSECKHIATFKTGNQLYRDPEGELAVVRVSRSTEGPDRLEFAERKGIDDVMVMFAQDNQPAPAEIMHEVRRCSPHRKTLTTNASLTPRQKIVFQQYRWAVRCSRQEEMSYSAAFRFLVENRSQAMLHDELGTCPFEKDFESWRRCLSRAVKRMDNG